MLLNKLAGVNQEINTQYADVNKKALDQYRNFTEQRDDLHNRLVDIENAKGSIDGMVQFLDQQKDEALFRTYRGVSRAFSEVFKELVPSGAASIIMRTDRQKANPENDDELEGSQDPTLSEVREFVGLKISARVPPSLYSRGNHQESNQLIV